MSHILVEKQGGIKLICWSDGRSLLDSNESTREENAPSELVELAFTQIIAWQRLKGVGATLPLASISLAGSPFSSWAPVPCDVTVHAWPWMAGSPLISVALPLASISLAGSPFSSWAPIPSDVTVHHGLGWPEVHISVVRCMSFS